MAAVVNVRRLIEADLARWRPLWDSYNAFYGREGTTALPEAVTRATWERFFDPNEPVFGLIAESGGAPVGLAHYLFHRSTMRIEPICYLNDLFTEPSLRGGGIGRALIAAVYEAARAAGSRRVYWQTQESNAVARTLYDKVAARSGFIVYGQDV